MPMNFAISASNMLVRRALAADEAGGQGADAEIVDLAFGFLADARMVGEAEIVVIGEADEMAALRLAIRLELVDLREKRIVEFEQGVAGEAETPRRIIREASVSRH